MAIRVSGQHRSLDDGCFLDDVLSRDGEVEFESPHKGKEYCFHPRIEEDECVVAIPYWDLLDQGKPISNTGTRSTQESEHITPDTWYGVCSSWNRLPPLRSSK